MFVVFYSVSSLFIFYDFVLLLTTIIGIKTVIIVKNEAAKKIISREIISEEILQLLFQAFVCFVDAA